MEETPRFFYATESTAESTAGLTARRTEWWSKVEISCASNGMGTGFISIRWMKKEMKFWGTLICWQMPKRGVFDAVGLWRLTDEIKAIPEERIREKFYWDQEKSPGTYLEQLVLFYIRGFRFRKFFHSRVLKSVAEIFASNFCRLQPRHIIMSRCESLTFVNSHFRDH